MDLEPGRPYVHNKYSFYIKSKVFTDLKNCYMN